MGRDDQDRTYYLITFLNISGLCMNSIDYYITSKILLTMENTELDAIVKEYENDILSPETDYSEILILDLVDDLTGNRTSVENGAIDAGTNKESLQIEDKPDENKDAFFPVRKKRNYMMATRDAGHHQLSNENARNKDIPSTLMTSHDILTSEPCPLNEALVPAVNVTMEMSHDMDEPICKKRRAGFSSGKDSRDQMVYVNGQSNSLSESYCPNYLLNSEKIVGCSSPLSDLNPHNEDVPSSMEAEQVGLSPVSKCRTDVKTAESMEDNITDTSDTLDVVEISDDSDLEILDVSFPRRQSNVDVKSVKVITDKLSSIADKMCNSSSQTLFRPYTHGYLMGLLYKTVKVEEKKAMEKFQDMNSCVQYQKPNTKIIQEQTPVPICVKDRSPSTAYVHEHTVVPVGTLEHNPVPVGTKEHAVVPVGTQEQTPVPVGTPEHTVVSVGTPEHTVVSVGTPEHTVVSIGTLTTVQVQTRVPTFVKE